MLFRSPVAIERYFGLLSDVSRSANARTELDIKEVRFRNATVRQSTPASNGSITFGTDIDISFDYETEQFKDQDIEFRVGVKLPTGIVASMMRFRRRARASEHLSLQVRDPRFVPGTYFLNIAACPIGADVHIGGISNATSFRVEPPTAGDYRFEYGQEYMVLFDYTVNGERQA